MIKLPDYFDSLIEQARARAEKAMVKFPQPNYVLNKVAEENGEVIKAVIHYTEGRETWANVEAELIDNLAMLIRLVKEGDQVIGFTPPAEVQRLNATAHPVSDDTAPLLTYLKECSEQVSRWPEWKKKGSDVTALIKEMDDFELGFVNGWSERHKQPVSDGWVKCSERMPLEKSGKMDEIVVLVTDGNSVGMAACYSGDLPKPWVSFSSYGDVHGTDITHWMPLPAAPVG